jgi:hypothetical protein
LGGNVDGQLMAACCLFADGLGPLLALRFTPPMAAMPQAIADAVIA